VSFTDELHGWAVGGGNLVGYIIAAEDGGEHWTVQGEGNCGPLTSVRFSDALHETIEGWDGDSPQRPIILTTSDGRGHWAIRHR
jgi:hypothetical protein